MSGWRMVLRCSILRRRMTMPGTTMSSRSRPEKRKTQRTNSALIKASFCWARLNINGEFHYATLISLARHLLDILDETGSEQIESLIPHRYVEGKNHGKREQDGTVWNFQLDAGG